MTALLQFFPAMRINRAKDDQKPHQFRRVDFPACWFAWLPNLFSDREEKSMESGGMRRTPNASRIRQRVLPREAFGVRGIPALSFSQTPGRRGFLYPFICLVMLLFSPFCAQADTNNSSSAHNLKSKIENLNSSSAPTPLPYTNASPVALFRELLSMDPKERAKRLADRPEGNRKLIIAKLAQYKMLNPDERELRLRATELWWYLFPLMHQAATNRDEQIKAVPADFQQPVRDRLRAWDQLSTALQSQFLENLDVLRHLSDQRANITNSITAARRVQLESGVSRFQALPEADRKQLLDRFTQFFDLTPEERDKWLKTLSQPERRQIEKTLRAVRDLDAAQRAQLMHSFEEFARLSPAERQRFLKNVDRWQLLTPTERDKWRELVQQAPVLPVDRDVVGPAPVPVPASRSGRGPGPTTSFVTNRN
ncbi:MAG: hypothetical protein C5B50_22165 [Verrucomicrobia bacterium]|nr:MAG: hypothetical protein C5B50_22165 [Verrucomicrobiota bacterium]